MFLPVVVMVHMQVSGRWVVVYSELKLFRKIIMLAIIKGYAMDHETPHPVAMISHINCRGWGGAY